MTDEPTFVLPFHGVEDFPPESAPLAVKSAQATSNGLIDPVMFGPNITGSTSWDVNGLGKAGVGYSSCGSSRISNNGAMSVSTGTYWACIGSSGADCGNNAVVNINAKNSNSVYGSSSTVQPSSVRSLFCIKT